MGGFIYVWYVVDGIYICLWEYANLCVSMGA